jgi:type IV fimbrial biogenesis protein FimT
MNAQTASRTTGFTLIELMVVLAVIGVVLALAAPSFTGFLARKRVEGVAAELMTDLQLARSEAVARNAAVRLTFGTGCYVIHTVQTAGSTSCSQTGASSMGTGAVEIKTAQLSTGTTAGFSPDNALTRIEFDPVRAAATVDGGNAATGSVTVTNSAGSGQLRVSVSAATGRPQVCTPSGTIKGYATC